MSAEENYLEINRHSWNNRLEAHVNSDFYDLNGFLNGKTSLNAIELNLLGDVKNKRILHLQCHFGQDSLSLARLGASVVGVDLSDKAIAKANELASELSLDARFICCDVFALGQHLEEQFDIVFTSYGVIGWLPELQKWGKIINQFLKPNGKLIFVEFHPVVWMYDDNFEKVSYNYFNEKAIIEEESGTYADKNAAIRQEYICWNHALCEVFDALLSNGLQINIFQEFDYSPYNCLNGMEEFSPQKFRITKFGNQIPLVYAIGAGKR